MSECEKCGGEMSTRYAGDEYYSYCEDCGHVSLE